MPRIQTCGHESKRTTFSYQGNVEEGVILEFDSGNFEIPSSIIRNVIEHFQGEEVLGGFSMTNPVEGGVGHFLSTQSKFLTPRHASFLCAVMANEGYVSCQLSGNAVLVAFNT